MRAKLISICLIVLLLSGCAVHANVPTLAFETALPPTTASQPTLVPSQAAMLLSATVPLPSDTPLIPTQTVGPEQSARPVVQVCTPLQDINLEDLPELVSNPYHPPAAGSDDPHQGVDLSILSPGTDIALAGHTVQAAMAGQVAMVLHDRFPYGNALLVETALDGLPAAWQQDGTNPDPRSNPVITYRLDLSCSQQDREMDYSHRSLYILYAHLESVSELQPGDWVSCGQAVGTVGSSGNALNPHLHFETRVGPSAMRFSSMAHYDNSATQEEMSSYCLWRISGLFQLVDPIRVIGLSEE